MVRKRGWPTTIKTFRTKRDAQDWARRTEDEMVRGVYIDRTDASQLLLKAAATAAKWQAWHHPDRVTGSSAKAAIHLQ